MDLNHIRDILGRIYTSAVFLFLSLRIADGWPEGTWGLPMPQKGCPAVKSFEWETGIRIQKTEKGSHPSKSIHLAGVQTTETDRIQQSFCMKTDFYARDGNYEWAPGQYCVYRRGDCPANFKPGWIYWDDAAPWFNSEVQAVTGQYCIYRRGTCPDGFKMGWIYWDDDAPWFGSTVQGLSGTLPDGEYDRNTKIEFCCRTDGPTSKEIELPTDSPFYLLKLGDNCQKVKGMSFTDEWVLTRDESSVNLNTQSGLYPRVIRSKYPIRYTKLFYCYYIPKEDNGTIAIAMMVLYIVGGIFGGIVLILMLICLVKSTCGKKTCCRETDMNDDSNGAGEQMLSGNGGAETVVEFRPSKHGGLDNAVECKIEKKEPKQENGDAVQNGSATQVSEGKEKESRKNLTPAGPGVRPISQPPPYEDVMVPGGMVPGLGLATVHVGATRRQSCISRSSRRKSHVAAMNPLRQDEDDLYYDYYNDSD